MQKPSFPCIKFRYTKDAKILNNDLFYNILKNQDSDKEVILFRSTKSVKYSEKVQKNIQLKQGKMLLINNLPNPSVLKDGNEIINIDISSN